MNKKIIAGLSTLAALLSVTSGSVQAAETGAFTVFDIGQSRLDQSTGAGINSKKTDTSWALGGGYNFTDYLGIEGGFRRIGKTSMTAPAAVTGNFLGKLLVTSGGFGTTTDTDGFYVGPVLNYKVNEGLRLNARAGVYLWTNTATATGASFLQYNGVTYAAGSVLRLKNHGEDEYWGAGGTYRIRPNLDVGLNYNRYKADSRVYDVFDLRFKFSF